MLIDDSFPSAGPRLRPVAKFGSSKQRDELWVMVLEKAYAPPYNPLQPLTTPYKVLEKA